MVVFVGRIRDPLARFVGSELAISVDDGAGRLSGTDVDASGVSPMYGYGAGSTDRLVESVGRVHVPFTLVLVYMRGFPIC